MGKGRPFIRNGVVVYDASEQEREAARRTPFPGTGRRLDGGPVVPSGLTLSLRRRRDDEESLQFVGGDDGPPPGGGGGAVLHELQPSLQLLPMCCGWTPVEMSCLRLVLLVDINALMQRLRERARRRLQLIQLLSLGNRIPAVMPRPVFRPDVNFRDSDIGSRAIADLLECFDLSSGVGTLSETLQCVSTYRTHPLAINLTTNLTAMILRRSRVRLVFPQDSGEVMYVINTSYEVIIAARSGHQRDLPHPTLIGGDDPEVLSAGLVIFREGRISCVFINASGHFKPNDLSSIEVSMQVFSRLPTDAFHPEFLGYQVFRHGGHLMIQGPVPTGGGSLYQPFRITGGPDLRGTMEATSALERRAQMQDVFALLRNMAKKAVNGMLMNALVNGLTQHPLLGLMTHDMRATFNRLHLLVSGTPNIAGARQRVLGSNSTFQALVEQLLLRLQGFLS